MSRNALLLVRPGTRPHAGLDDLQYRLRAASLDATVHFAEVEPGWDTQCRITVVTGLRYFSPTSTRGPWPQIAAIGNFLAREFGVDLVRYGNDHEASDWDQAEDWRWAEVACGGAWPHVRVLASLRAAAEAEAQVRRLRAEGQIGQLINGAIEHARGCRRVADERLALWIEHQA